jgi:hypothetical protein
MGVHVQPALRGSMRRVTNVFLVGYVVASACQHLNARDVMSALLLAMVSAKDV